MQLALYDSVMLYNVIMKYRNEKTVRTYDKEIFARKCFKLLQKGYILLDCMRGTEPTGYGDKILYIADFAKIKYEKIRKTT